MMPAPSSSAPRITGRRKWLTCAANADTGSGAARPGPLAWRAIDSRIIARSSWSVIRDQSSADRHRVDDADDRGVHGRAFLAERLARRPPFEHDQHFLVHAGADAVHGKHRIAARRVVDVQRLHDHQLGAFELAVLLLRDDGADDSTDLHT